MSTNISNDKQQMVSDAAHRTKSIANDQVIQLRPVHSPANMEQPETARELPARPCFRLLTIDDLMALPEREWLLAGIVPQGGLACLYGPPAVGKSFLGLDWSLSVASGHPWYGQQVKQGNVVYVLAEGDPRSIRPRISAWLESRRIRADQIRETFRLIDSSVDLLSPLATEQLVNEIRAQFGETALVVIDTLARCFATGDENATRDMSAFIANVDAIRHATGAAVMVVHHSGKVKERGARGANALEAAADTMLSMSLADNVISLTCTKQKDAPEFSPYRMVLSKFRNSAVLEFATGRLLDKLSPTQAQLLEVLTSSHFRDVGTTFSQLRSLTEVSDKTLSRALATLQEKGCLRSQGVPRSQNRRYFITLQGAEATRGESVMDMDRRTGPHLDAAIGAA